MNNDERALIRYVCDGDMRRAQMQARCILGGITSQRDAAFRDDMIRRIDVRKGVVKLPDSLKGLVDDSAVFPESKFLLRKTETEAVEKIISLYRAAERLANMGIPYLPALMLYGESGCGKTELARYIAHRAELPFAYVRFSWIPTWVVPSRISQKFLSMSAQTHVFCALTKLMPSEPPEGKRMRWEK